VKDKTLKIVIPMGGYGTRLRPHTWSRPKQLIRLAGKTVLDHVLDTFTTLPDAANAEYIFIVGNMGEKIEAHMQATHPDLTVHYVEQSEMRGQSHAIYLARQYLSGPMLMVFADTLVETNLSFLKDEGADAIAWVKPVPDPRRFGVAVVGPDGWVTNLIEKPKAMDNNLVVVGFYYFKDSTALVAAITEQMRRDIKLKNEYFLADAVNIMLESKIKMRTQEVKTWLDAGTAEDVLSTNRYLLENGHDNSVDAAKRPNVVLIPPVYIHPSAQVEYSVIGPHVAIGADCQVGHCILRDSIVDDCTQVTDVVMERSLIGREANIKRRPGVLNVGDHTELTI